MKAKKPAGKARKPSEAAKPKVPPRRKAAPKAPRPGPSRRGPAAARPTLGAPLVERLKARAAALRAQQPALGPDLIATQLSLEFTGPDGGVLLPVYIQPFIEPPKG